MGRGRGKGKKQIPIPVRDDVGSGEEEKIPTYRRRGRPQKPLKDEIEVVEEAVKVEEEDTNNGENNVKNEAAVENGRKRKRSSLVTENHDTINPGNGVTKKTGVDATVQPVGFRQNGSRRKNKPRRAAEVGVGC